MSVGHTKFISRGRILLPLLFVAAGLGIGWGLASLFGQSSTPATGSDAPKPSSAVHDHDESDHAAFVDLVSEEAKTLYTCGMHPEVISDEPGTCPKCQMNLTPMAPDRARMILEARGEAVPEKPAGERKILYWRAPMDPTYIREEPGKSPMGMDLVPVYADDVSGGPTISIDPVTEQNMGLRYDVVRMGPLEKTVRTVGVVRYDERNQGKVTTKIDGWVEKVHIAQTGVQVHEDEPLFELYAPDLFSAQEELLVALRDLEAAEARGAEQAAALARRRLESARDRLRFFDISDEQIERLETQRKIHKTLTIPSLLTGVVTKKNIVEGDYLKAGQTAYELADLSTVWVIGKVFESDLPFVRVGQEAHMELDYLPGRTYRGRVTYIYPYLEEGTREVPVRMEFHNPGYDLKPGMYATIEIKARLDGESVLAPESAIIDTGERQVAFVARGPGKFEPRRLEVGVRAADNKRQILSGLAPGETLVVSGQFLLDSESRLREATLKMLEPGLTDTDNILKQGPSSQPTSMPADLAHDHEHAAVKTAAGETKYVCPMPSHAGILYETDGACPICGMNLVPVESWRAEESRVAYFTCPMPEHHDIHEAEPGNCPRCGMTLIPVMEDEVDRFLHVDPTELPDVSYTCPMPEHRHVVSAEPGNCPECGMELIPIVKSAKDSPASQPTSQPTENE